MMHVSSLSGSIILLVQAAVSALDERIKRSNGVSNPLAIPEQTCGLYMICRLQRKGPQTIYRQLFFFAFLFPADAPDGGILETKTYFLGFYFFCPCCQESLGGNRSAFFLPWISSKLLDKSFQRRSPNIHVSLPYHPKVVAVLNGGLHVSYPAGVASYPAGI